MYINGMLCCTAIETSAPGCNNRQAIGAGMWWVVGIFIGGYLAFIAWKFGEAMLHFLYLVIRDAVTGKDTDRKD